MRSSGGHVMCGTWSFVGQLDVMCGHEGSFVIHVGVTLGHVGVVWGHVKGLVRFMSGLCGVGSVSCGGLVWFVWGSWPHGVNLVSYGCHIRSWWVIWWSCWGHVGYVGPCGGPWWMSRVGLVWGVVWCPLVSLGSFGSFVICVSFLCDFVFFVFFCLFVTLGHFWVIFCFLGHFRAILDHFCVNFGLLRVILFISRHFWIIFGSFDVKNCNPKLHPQN